MFRWRPNGFKDLDHQLRCMFYTVNKLKHLVGYMKLHVVNLEIVQLAIEQVCLMMDHSIAKYFLGKFSIVRKVGWLARLELLFERQEV